MAVHVTELRTAVNAVLSLAGLPAATYTDPTITAGIMINAIDISELRTNLDAARLALGLPTLSYTDGTLTAGSTPIKAVHFTELRNGVK